MAAKAAKAAKAAIRRQWRALLQTHDPTAPSDQWAASVALLASAAAAASALAGRDEDAEHSRATCDAAIGISGVESPLRPERAMRNAAHCEGLLPYHRLSQRPNGAGGSHSGRAAGFGPWQPMERTSRKSLLHRRSRHGNEKELDMHEKYNVDFGTVLGEGAYGRVHPARLVDTGEKVALKKISKQYTDSASFGSETDALLRIYENGGHPNISGLRDMYEDFSHYYLFLDLARGGEMFDHLIQHGQYSEFDASRLVTEILSALAFLHNTGIVHADLKPENILLCSRKKGAETVKIIDFGCASADKRGESLFSGKDGRQKGWKRNITTAVEMPSIGTKAYWSPERFQKDAPVTDSVDLYALGVIVFIMLVGVHPFDPKGIASDEEIQEQIQKSAGPPMNLTSHLSPSARDFIKSLMERDPNKRLTAITALQHPWIRGVTPSLKIIEGSDTKLSMYQDLRDKLASGIFAALVDGKNLSDKASEANAEEQSLTHLLKRAFQVFDEEGKGYVNEADLSRVMTKVTGSSMSASDSKDMIAAAKKESPQSSSAGLSLSDFSSLFSRLSHQHYKRGDFIYHPGDDGDAMYFLNSGKVEILTRKGHLVSILRHGDFFGEGSLLEDRNHRITAARCSTPVDVIAVSKRDFNRYVSSSSTRRSLKLKWRARNLSQAKQLIRLQTNLTKKKLHEGDVVYQEGDIGRSMFLVDEGTLEVKHGDDILHTLSPGDSFGESSLLFQRPRSSTVVCASRDCGLHEMRGDDFAALLESDPAHARALSDMCRKRMFQKAVKSYLLSQKSDLGEEEFVKAFRDADKDESGTLSLGEMRDLMLNMGTNSSIPEKDLEELLKSLDFDEDGQVTLKDIVDMSKSFK